MKKKILVLLIAIAAIICCSSVVSAGLFDFFGGGVQNQTHEFSGGVSFDFPENCVVTDITNADDDPYHFYRVVNNETGGRLMICTVPKSKVVSLEQYISNLKNSGYHPEKQGTYGDWTILKFGDNEGYKYELYYKGSSTQVLIDGDDLQLLKNVADTFKET